MKTITEIVERVRSGQNLLKIELCDASRYISNARGAMSFNSTIWHGRCVRSYKATDEIVSYDQYETNVSEVERILRSLIGKGNVKIWLSGENPEVGEINE